MKKIILILLIVGTTIAQNPWQVVKDATLHESSTKGFFLDQNTGWLGAQNGAIFHTNDSGVNWVVQRDTSSNQSDINGIYFFDLNNGWACGDDGTILYTTDGGSSWQQSSNVPTIENLEGIDFPTASIGYACGAGGVIIKTDNGGISWILLNTPTTLKLSGIEFFDANNGIAVINKPSNTVL